MLRGKARQAQHKAKDRHHHYQFFITIQLFFIKAYGNPEVKLTALINYPGASPRGIGGKELIFSLMKTLRFQTFRYDPEASLEVFNE